MQLAVDLKLNDNEVMSLLKVCCSQRLVSDKWIQEYENRGTPYTPPLDAWMYKLYPEGLRDAAYCILP